MYRRKVVKEKGSNEKSIHFIFLNSANCNYFIWLLYAVIIYGGKHGRDDRWYDIFLKKKLCSIPYRIYPGLLYSHREKIIRMNIYILREYNWDCIKDEFNSIQNIYFSQWNLPSLRGKQKNTSFSVSFFDDNWYCLQRQTWKVDHSTQSFIGCPHALIGGMESSCLPFIHVHRYPEDVSVSLAVDISLKR